MMDDITALGVRGRREPRGLFRGVLPQAFDEDERRRQMRGRGAGIIPDAMLNRISLDRDRRLLPA